MEDNNDKQDNSLLAGKPEEENNLANGAKKIGKAVGREIVTKFILPVLPWVLLLIIVVVIAGSLFSIFSEVGSTISGLWQDFINSITTQSGKIEITDELAEDFINKVEESTGIKFRDLKLAGDIDYSAPDRQEEIKKANIKYVKMFLEAQIITQEINRPGVEGRVYLYRANAQNNSTEEATELIYTSPEDFESKLQSANSTGDEYIMQLFTLNASSEIIVANKTEKTVNGTVTKTFEKAPPQPYKNLISQYSTPAQFFIYLGEIVQSPKFLEEVVKLIKEDTTITLTILENTTTEETTENYTYDVLVRQDVELGNRGNLGYRFVPEDPKQEHSQTTTTKVVNTSVSLAVTYVNTWQIEQKMPYEKVVSDPQVSTTVTGQDGIPEIEDEEGSQDVDSIKVNQVITTTKTITTANYKAAPASDYKYKAGEKPDEDTSYTSFVDLLDEKFSLPNSTQKVVAGLNLRSGAEWFFKLLAQDPDTSNMENFMRYVMYKYTGKNYGVTELDFSAFDPDYFSSTSIVSGLAGYLLQFAHGTNYAAPQSDDGKYYLMYGDSAENELGWPTIGNADIQWASHHAKFNVPGKVLENGVEKDVASVEEYVNNALGRGATAKYTTAEIRQKQIYVEKSVVDSVGDTLTQSAYNAVQNLTSGLNLSRQQLYALTALYMNRPAYLSGDTINGYHSFKEAYLDASKSYEPNSWQHNRFIWDNWWNYLHGGMPGHITSRDMSFETFVKGVYDYNQSSAGPLGARHSYLFYTQKQIDSISYAPRLKITRTASNEQELFTYVENKLGINGTTTVDGLELATYTNSAGRTFIEYKQNVGPWANKPFGSKVIGNNGCPTAAISIVLSGYGYDVTPMKYAGYSGLNAHQEAANYGLRVGDTVSVPGDGYSAQPDQKYIEDIRQHLRSGGVVIIHVRGKGMGGYNPRAHSQHWMAVLDINDAGDQVYVSAVHSAYANGWDNINTVLSSLWNYSKIKP